MRSVGDSFIYSSGFVVTKLLFMRIPIAMRNIIIETIAKM
jgi:hypothetical protein